MKKKEYNQKHKKNLRYDYDDNIKNTSPKKNMNPKKSVTLSEAEKMWKSLQNALVEKGSTPITGYPLKVGQLRSITRQFLEEQLNIFFDKLAVIFNEEYIVFKEDGFGWLRNSKLLLPLYEGTEDIIFSDVLKTNTSTKEHAINYTDEARIQIPTGIQKVYTKKEISYTSKSSCKVFSANAINAYYNNYKIELSKNNQKLLQMEIIIKKVGVIFHGELMGTIKFILRVVRFIDLIKDLQQFSQKELLFQNLTRYLLMH